MVTVDKIAEALLQQYNVISPTLLLACVENLYNHVHLRQFTHSLDPRVSLTEQEALEWEKGA